MWDIYLPGKLGRGKVHTKNKVSNINQKLIFNHQVEENLVWLHYHHETAMLNRERINSSPRLFSRCTIRTIQKGKEKGSQKTNYDPRLSMNSEDRICNIDHYP